MPFRGQNVRHVFSGGWATDFGPNAEVGVSQNGLVEIPWLNPADNCIYELDGGPRKVGGLTKFNSSALESGASIRGLYDYWKMGTSGTPSNRRIVYVNDSIYSDNNDASFVQIDSGMETGEVPVFAQMDDEVVWMTTSTSDPPKRYDGTTVNTWDTTIPFTTISMATSHKNRIWCAGDPSNPSVLYFSPLADEDGVAGNWNQSGGFIQIDPGDGDRIVGVASHKDSLFVFKGPYKGSIHRITGSSPTGGDPFARTTFVEGLAAVAHNAIFHYRDDLGFLCCDGTVHSLAATAAHGDFLEAALSRPIHEWLHLHVSPSQLGQAWSVNDQRSGRVWLGVAADTETQINNILSMDYRFNPVRWSLISSFDDECQSAAIVVDTTNVNRPEVWLGGTDGFVRKANQVTRSIDGSTAISFSVRTPKVNYGSSIRMKTAYHGGVAIATKGSSTLTFGWQRDTRPEETVDVSQSGGDVLAADQTPTPATGAFTLDSSQLGGNVVVNRFFSLHGEFRDVAYSMANAGLNEDIEVHGFMAGIKAGADSLEN